MLSTMETEAGNWLICWSDGAKRELIMRGGGWWKVMEGDQWRPKGGEKCTPSLASAHSLRPITSDKRL